MYQVQFSKIKLFILAVLGVLIFDQGLKYFLMNDLKNVGDNYNFLGIIEFYLVFNRGVAFGIGSSVHTFFILTGLILALVVFLFIYFRYLLQSSALTHIASGFVFGGALGNLVDRILRGVVIDYINLYNIPSFNIADLAIILGVCVVIVEYIKKNIVKK